MRTALCRSQTRRFPCHGLANDTARPSVSASMDALQTGRIECASFGRSVTARAFTRPLEASRFPMARASVARPQQRCHGSPSLPGRATRGRPRGRGPPRSCPSRQGPYAGRAVLRVATTPPATLSRQYRMCTRPGGRLLIGPRDAVHRGFVKGLANDLHG
jgi:hypothetical protein